MKYFQSAIYDYESKIYQHGIVIKPELDLYELKLKSKEYYDRILATQKKKEEAKKLREKKAKEEVKDVNSPSLEEKVDFLYSYLGIKFGENNSKRVSELVTPKKKNLLEDDEDDARLAREIKSGLHDIKK